jgi:hypothetical protein
MKRLFLQIDYVRRRAISKAAGSLGLLVTSFTVIITGFTCLELVNTYFHITVSDQYLLSTQSLMCQTPGLEWEIKIAGTLKYATDIN